jgi:ribosomal protein L23
VINSSTLTNANIIKYPLITDKATRLLENNQYSFIVDRNSDKITIKNTIEYLFDVKLPKLIVVVFLVKRNVYEYPSL